MIFTGKMFPVLLLFFFVSAAQGLRPIIEVPRDFDLSNVNSRLARFPREELKEGSDCDRPCVPGGENRICYYEFNVEHYAAMGIACGNCSLGLIDDCSKPQCVPVDGYERGIITVNRQIPGPAIEVCQDDIIVVDLLNHMHSDTFSMHWHGVDQRGTPYMDGVPYVTQCPISPASEFRYSYRAELPGTSFYHSHSGIQRYNGAYGGLVVRSPSDPHAFLYDEDSHRLLLAEWSHEAPEMFMVGLPTRMPGLLPQGELINGKGRHLKDEASQTFTLTPYDNLYVTRGKRYRFRVVNAGSSVCAMQLQIQDHKMTIIATDGTSTVPVTVDTLYLVTGERYDVVVNADQPVGLYWVHVKSVAICVVNKIFQTAVLSYIPNSGATHQIPSGKRSYDGYPKGVTYNDMTAPCSNADNFCVSELKSKEPSNQWNSPVDQKLYFTFSIKNMNSTRFFEGQKYTPFLNTFGDLISLGTMNDFSFMPPSSPLLSQPDRVDPNKLCGVNRIPSHCKDMEVCTCTQVINIVENGIVEIVLIDVNAAPSVTIHPMHFHGFKFAVVSEGQFLDYPEALTVEKIKEFEAQGLLKGNNSEPVYKDNIAIRTKGFVVMRFKADNPGSWIVHCHIEDHMMYGMALVLNIAGRLPPVPANFPKCGNFL